jgi:beta-fructofuranosidase
VLEYVVGDFDPASGSFAPSQKGILDAGASHTAHYYASNIFFDGRGRCILLGWIRGFPAGKGWNGCLAVPRILKPGPGSKPLQQPVPELNKLRGSYHGFAGTRPDSGAVGLVESASTTAEWLIEMSLAGRSSGGVRLVDAEENEIVSVGFGDNQIIVGEQHIPYERPNPADPIRLHAFVDRSTIELFVDDGQLAVTRIFEPGLGPLRLEAFGSNSVIFQRLDVWDMKPIWSTTS